MTIWTEQDLPVLRWLVAHFEPIDAHDVVGLDALANETGLPRKRVQAALRNLHRAGYLTGITSSQLPYPSRVSGVTTEALRAAQEWPSPEALVDALVRDFAARADASEDPQQRSALRGVVDYLTGVGRDIAVGVVTNQLG